MESRAFYENISQYGDAIALVSSESGNISYNELEKDICDFKIYLRKGLAFCLCENNVESIVGYLAFLQAGVVPVLLSDNINIELLNALLLSYKPRYIWLAKRKLNDFADCKVVFEYKQFVLLETNCIIDYSLFDQLALLLTTSGSTGSPKLVRQSYKNINSNAESIAQYLNISSTDKPITTLPMSYTYGLSIINSHLLKGCTIVLTNKTLMDKEFWNLLKTQQVTTFGGVPYIYEMLKKLRFERMNIPSLKVLTQAGGRLGIDLTREFAEICHKKGIRLFVMYGQTEATARMSYLPSEFAMDKAGSIGIAIPCGEFWLEDECGNEIETFETVGELVYRGANVMLGYSESCNDLCKSDENCGLLRTGDMARRDEEGFYYVTGRKKRFLKIFGNRVNLDEVEHILERAGFESVCAGEDDNMRIYVTDERVVDNVRKYIIENTGINQAGFKVEFISEIPRNESGKKVYSLLN